MMCWWAAFFIAGSFFGCGRDGFLAGIVAFCASIILAHSPFQRRFHVNDRYLRSPSYTANRVKALVVCASGLLILSSVDLSRNINDFKRESRVYAGGAYRTSGISSAEGGGSGIGNEISSHLISPIREYMLDSFGDGRLTDESSMVLRALVLSFRDDKGAEMRDTYAYLGLAHLLALSGAHLGVLAVALSWVLKIFPMRKWRKNLLLLALMTIYTFAAGRPDSLLRSLALLVAFNVISALCVRENLVGALAMSGLMVLSIDYGLIYSWGFQLSFLAVAGIALLGIPLKKSAEKLWFWSRITGAGRMLAVSLVITVSVQAIMLPLVLEMFGKSPLLATIPNLVMTIPVMSALILGFVYSVVPVDWFRHLLSVPVNLVTHIMCSVPSAMMELGRPGIYRGQVWYPPYICGIAFFCSALKAGTSGRGGKTLLAMILVAVSFLQCVPGSLKISQPGISMEGSHWKEIELHEGTHRALVIGKGLGITYARKLVKDLWVSGISSIDYVIILTTDADLLRGLPFIIERLGCEATICSPYLRGDLEGMRVFSASGSGRPRLISVDHEISMGGYRIIVRQPPFPPAKGKTVSEKRSRLELKINKSVE